MRFLAHISLSFLICSLCAGMNLPGTPRSDICEGGWTGFQSVHIHEPDPATVHHSKVRNREPDAATIPCSKRLKLSDNSGEGFHTYVGSSEPSGEDAEMTDSAENIIGGGHNDVSNYHHQVWQEFQGWREMLLGSQLTEDQRMSVQGELGSFEQATTQLSQRWQGYYIWKEEASKFSIEDYVLIKEQFKKLIMDDTTRCLQSVFNIDNKEKLLPEWKLEDKMIRHMITKGYELMLNFMIDFKHMRLISEEDLSIFLNEKTDGQIITSYAIWSHFDPITGPHWHNNIKENLLMNRSVHGLPEILNLLNQETWQKIEVNYLYYQLRFLFQDKSLNKNYFFHVLTQFLEKGYENKLKVTIDDILVFMKHLSFSLKHSAQKNSAEILEGYMKQEGISNAPIIKAVFPSTTTIDALGQLSEENPSLSVLLGSMRDMLIYHFLSSTF